MLGTISNLFIKTERGLPMKPVNVAKAVAEKGLVGDRAFGKPSRQILLIDSETLEKFELRPGQARENVTTTGIDHSLLREGSRLTIGEVVLTVTQPCSPCDMLEDLKPGLREAIAGRRGMLATVEHGGTIQMGDSISVDG